MSGPESRRPTAPFRLTIQTDRQPYCPQCGDRIWPQACEIRRSVLWCQKCATAPAWVLDTAVTALNEQIMLSEVAAPLGIVFYVPRGSLEAAPPACILLRDLTEADQRRGSGNV